MSVLGNSSNQKFNAFQAVIGFFLESKQCPEVILEMAAHMGISVSIQSISRMVNSLSRKAEERIKNLGPSNHIYDNFDMEFPVAHPTPDHQKVHLSATAATFVPYQDVDHSLDLRFTQELRETSEYNINLSPDDPRIYKPQFDDVYPTTPLTEHGEDQEMSPYDALAWHFRSILIEHGGTGFAQFKSKLGQPASIQSLPVKKTSQHPGRAMHADESIYDGNWEVLLHLCQQKDWLDAELELFLELFHSDLATRERLEELRRMRVMKHSAKNRLDFIIFVLGLFHLKMAAANAYWRIHVEPKNDRDEPLGVYEYISYLRPKATAEFTSKNGPGFRPMHEVIHHTTWTDILECWAVEVKDQLGLISLEAFAASDPSWDDIVSMSETLVQKYLPTDDFSDEREKVKTERDTVFENLRLRNQHGLLYLELARAMNYGDVGRILQLFPYYIAIFTATGKDKYATHMIKFYTDLNHVYPPRLRKAILRNWLCNPKGTPDGFRALDWLQELNNLYTKVSQTNIVTCENQLSSGQVIFARQGPNRTKELVFKRSVLLEVYRSMQRSIEENFYLNHCTVHHTKPTMTKTLLRLRNQLAILDGFRFKKGRSTSTPASGRSWVVHDAISEGFALLVQKKSLYTVGESSTEESETTNQITSDDLGVL